MREWAAFVNWKCVALMLVGYPALLGIAAVIVLTVQGRGI